MVSGEQIRAWIDSAAKLIAALVAATAVLAAAIIGARFESKLTSVSLLSQREDSESRIRSSMFQSLVDPIIRSSQEDTFDPLRYRVLVEVLTLNFHDQVEVKPLLIDVDQILTEIDDVAGRRSIRSIARRVIDRQITTLSATSHVVHGQPAKAQTFYFSPDIPGDKPFANCEVGTLANPAPLSRGNVCSASLDASYYLQIQLAEPDFDASTASVNVTICNKEPPCVEERHRITAFSFTLTHFDFPLTDNSQVDPDHRFAISLYAMDKGEPIAIKVIWFPEGFVTARERPMNYLTLRKVLGVDGEE
jgi:hypothetical protein